jgi:long-subunit fatty acid transport protein
MKRTGDQKLYLFGRYDYYDSYIPTANALTDYQWTDRHVMTLGVNYYPIKQVVVKAEYAKRFLKEQYNDEPAFSLGVAYSGFFTR